MTTSKKRKGLLTIAMILISCADRSGRGASGDPADAGADAAVVDTESAAADFDLFGVCGVSGEVVMSAADPSGYAERYLIGEEGFGDDLCRVRYPLRLAGEPAVPCEACDFAFVAIQGEPEVRVNLNSACDKSALELDDDAIAGGVGERTAYGYAAEYVGHSGVLMQLDAGGEIWQAVAFASYDASTETLFFDRRDGYCGYQAP